MSDFLRDFFGIKSKSNSNKSSKVTYSKDAFPLPVKNLSNIISGTDGRYKLVMRVSPVNAKVLDDADLESIAFSIQSALAGYDLGRGQIVIQNEKINLEKNIRNIDSHIETLNNEIKIDLCCQQKEYFESLSKRNVQTSRVNSVPIFYMVIETSEKDYITAENILVDVFQGINKELSIQGMEAVRLMEHDIKRILYERMNPESSALEPYQESWSLNNILPEMASREEDGKYLLVENLYFRHFALTGFPSEVEKYCWLDNIIDMQGHVNISIVFTPKNKGLIQKELGNSLKNLKLRKNELQDKDYVEASNLESQIDSAQDMIRELGNANIGLYDTNITIGVAAESKKEVDRLSAMVRSRISSSFCQSTELRHKDFLPYFVTLPILPDNVITQNYTWNFTTSDLASLIPFNSSEFLDDKGTLIGENLISRSMIISNIFSRNVHNPHFAIIADSGSGKSFFLAHIIIQEFPYMDNIIQFDLDGSANFPWASKHRFSLRNGVCTNPFHIRNTKYVDDAGMLYDDFGGCLAEKILNAIDFFRWAIPNLTPLQVSLLEEDIRDMYEAKGITENSKILPSMFPTLSDWEKVVSDKILKPSGKFDSQECIDARKNYLFTMNSFINGSMSKMFNGQTNWDFEMHSILDISNVPDIVQKPLYDLLLKDTWQFIIKDGTLDRMPQPIYKKIVIDESHVLADKDNPQTLKFIAQKLTKQSRKFGGAVTTVTQNLSDYTAVAPYGDSILGNSYFKVFFRLVESDYEIAKIMYGFSEKEMKILKGSKRNETSSTGSKGKGIFRIGSLNIPFQCRAAKYELEIIDPVQFSELYKEKSRYI